MKWDQRLVDQFYRKCVLVDDCWVWRMKLSGKGYGRIEIAGKAYTAHRVSYEMMIADIPEGLQIDHLCCNKACVNPYHLEAVTGAINMQRRGARITHCPYGHEYTSENVKYNSRGSRNCRTCHNQRYNRRKHHV